MIRSWGVAHTGTIIFKLMEPKGSCFERIWKQNDSIFFSGVCNCKAYVFLVAGRNNTTSQWTSQGFLMGMTSTNHCSCSFTYLNVFLWSPYLHLILYIISDLNRLFQHNARMESSTNPGRFDRNDEQLQVRSFTLHPIREGLLLLLMVVPLWNAGNRVSRVLEYELQGQGGAREGNTGTPVAAATAPPTYLQTARHTWRGCRCELQWVK